MGYIVAKVSGISRGSNFGAPGEKFVFHNRSIEFISKRLLSNHTSVQASFALILLG